MANAKHYKISNPMRAGDGTLYRPGAAVPVAAKHVREFGWDKRATVDAPSRPQPAGSMRAREKRVKRQASTVRVLTRHNIEDINVDDLPDVLAGVDDQKAIAELKKADGRKTAAKHYEARLEALQPKPEKADEPDQPTGGENADADTGNGEEGGQAGEGDGGGNADADAGGNGEDDEK